MYATSDLRKGLKIELNGKPYEIVEYNFCKPGKGHALYNCKLKNILDGSTLSRTFRQHDQFDKPSLKELRLTYSYQDGDDYVFMDDEYNQIPIRAELLENSRHFLSEDMETSVLFYNDRPVEVSLPTFVEKELVETEPGARGNTATNVLKAAKIQGGYELSVPLFINQGDIIRIDTRTGEYADRVKKA